MICLVVFGWLVPGSVGLVFGLLCWLFLDHSETGELFLILCFRVVCRSVGVVAIDEVDDGLCVCCCNVCAVLCYVVSCDVLEG